MSKKLLLASVSSIALALSTSVTVAADLPVKAPVYTLGLPQNPWTVWVEGGPQELIGDPSVAGFGPGFNAPAKAWGWSGAFGLDFRFNGDWHLSGDFRYGANRERTSSSSPVATFGIPTTTGGTTPSAIPGRNSASRKEHNWVADFMVGRDIGLGSGNSQLEAGIRVAEIRGRTEGTASWSVPTSTTTLASNVAHTRTYVQTNRFFGVGPRLAVEGNAPLGGRWSIDYMGGIAVLFGTRKFEQTVSTSGAATCLSGCPINLSDNSDGSVFNPDAMIGLSYALTPNAKLSVNYRVDAYFGAMRVVDSGGNLKNADRIYQGPNVRLTFNFGNADVPAKALAYKPAPQTAPTFSWAGPYAGVNAGDGWRDPADFNTDLTSCTASGICVGGRVYGDPANQALGSSLGTGAGSRDNSFTGGGQIGYNWQIHNFVPGLEADFEYFKRSSSLSRSGVDTTGNTLTVTNEVDSNWLATIRSRFGYAWDRILIYGTGGVAFTRLHYQQTMATTLINSSGSQSVSKIATGWTVGAGAEYAISDRWSVRAEYLYTQFSDLSGTGILWDSPHTHSNVFTGSTGTLVDNVVRAGLDYRFGS